MLQSMVSQRVRYDLATEQQQEAKLQYSVGASLVAQMIKNLPAMQETWVLSLGWEDPLAKGIAAHSSTLAWRVPVGRGAWWAVVLGSHD